MCPSSFSFSGPIVGQPGCPVLPGHPGWPVPVHEERSNVGARFFDITLRRFAEFRNLHGAFGRRAIIEQAKGILMERHGIGADAAFALLRSHSQATGRRLVEVAEALTQSHRLLPGERRGQTAQDD